MILGKRNILVFLLLSGFMGTVVYGQFQFTDITEEAGISHHYLSARDMGGGAAFFDMDNDGDDDLWISGGLNRDVLYENDGKGNFTEIGFEAGLGVTFNTLTSGVITGDLDNDGFKDVLLLTHRGASNILLRNLGGKSFEEVTAVSGLGGLKAYSMAASMGDINLDGYLDIYVGHYIERDGVDRDADRDSVLGFSHDCYANSLYLNRGDFTFEEVGATWGVDNAGCTLATCFTDFDGDHDPDLLVANDFGQWILPNALYVNQYPAAGFIDRAEELGVDQGIYGMGIAIGDYDQDLDLDYYITNLGKNILLNHTPESGFEEVGIPALVDDTYGLDSLLAVGWGTVFMDMDNDTDLDLYVVNGYVPAAEFIENKEENPNSFFENVGEGQFQRVALEEGLASPQRGRGLACSDIDGDGDLDFLVVNYTKQATTQKIHKVELYRNDSENDHNWVGITLKGTANNAQGFGSKVLLYTGERVYLQEAMGGYGTHASQHSQVIHFGLGLADQIDSLVVFWPGGKKQVYRDLEINQIHELGEFNQVATSIGQVAEIFAKPFIYPNPFNSQISIAFNLKNSRRVAIRIFDALGREVYAKSLGNLSPGEHWLTWKSPNKGNFFLQVQSGQTFFYEKLISY